MKCGYCKKEPVEINIKESLEGNSFLLSILDNTYLCSDCYEKFMKPENRRNYFIYVDGKIKYVNSRIEINNFICEKKETPFLVRVKIIGQKKEYMNGLVNTDRGLFSFSHEELGCFSTENIKEFYKIYDFCKYLLTKYSKRFILDLNPTKKDKNINYADYQYIKKYRKDWRYIYATTIL
jgi:hypothetical protein